MYRMPAHCQIFSKVWPGKDRATTPGSVTDRPRAPYRDTSLSAENLEHTPFPCSRFRGWLSLLWTGSRGIKTGEPRRLAKPAMEQFFLSHCGNPTPLSRRIRPVPNLSPKMKTVVVTCSPWRIEFSIRL